jgi:hypothetical protein
MTTENKNQPAAPAEAFDGGPCAVDAGFGVWCVRHKDGWCATKRNRKPGEGRDSVETRCNHFVTLPWGYEQREPTCEECLTPNTKVTNSGAEKS